MASKQKHAERSRKSRNNDKSGMLYMNWNSNLKTQNRRRLKEMKDAPTS